MKYASVASIFNNDEAKLHFKYTVTCLCPFPSRVPVLISDLRNWKKAGSCAGFGGFVTWKRNQLLELQPVVSSANAVFDFVETIGCDRWWTKEFTPRHLPESSVCACLLPITICVPVDLFWRDCKVISGKPLWFLKNPIVLEENEVRRLV